MPPIPPKQTLAFDVYGTLLDTSSVSTALAQNLSIDDDKAKALAGLWRQLQLTYTFRLNSMGLYEPFDAVTRKSFLQAAKDSGYTVSDDTIDKICNAYWELGAYPDAVEALKELQKRGHVDVLVFSNGTPKMIGSALDAGGISSFIPRGFLVESVQKYKPVPDVYKGLLKYVGKESNPESVYLVSGNPFDVTGARNVGLSAIWVNRAGAEWTDALTDFKPTKVVKGLTEIPGLDLFA
ncbi:haloacid dehalogenase [Peniophora sp. CONT]|nr:haloacid dehalogenase [Peniophora sp. CONT]